MEVTRDLDEGGYLCERCDSYKAHAYFVKGGSCLFLCDACIDSIKREKEERVEREATGIV
jgi:hypothetical protein